MWCNSGHDSIGILAQHKYLASRIDFEAIDAIDAKSPESFFAGKIRQTGLANGRLFRKLIHLTG